MGGVGPARGPDLSRLVRDYGSIEEEALAARTDVALFDFSFMARARLRGDHCRAYLGRFQGRPLDRLGTGRIAYALRTDESGFVRSDLTIWNLGDDCFEVFSGDRRDIADLARSPPAGVEIEDLSDATAVFALQGPRTPEKTAPLFDGSLDDLPYFGCRAVVLGDRPCLAGRLGYTGEKGIELIVDGDAGELWRQLATLARPAGFGAMDRLRIEAGFILFVNECRLPVRPVELGLERFAGTGGDVPRLRLVGFRADAGLDVEPWCPGDPCRAPGAGAITVTSACRSAITDSVIGLGFVPAGEADSGGTAVDCCAGFGTVRLVPLPVHDPRKKRPRGPWRTSAAASGTGTADQR